MARDESDLCELFENTHRKGISSACLDVAKAGLRRLKPDCSFRSLDEDGFRVDELTDTQRCKLAAIA